MAELKSNLNDEIKSLSIFSLNGNNFLGKINDDEESHIIVTDAITITTDKFEEVIKKWIKSKNLNQLEKFEVKGNNNTLIKREFTEDKLMVIDIIVAKAEYAMKYAVNKLQNDSID